MNKLNLRYVKYKSNIRIRINLEITKFINPKYYFENKTYNRTRSI